MSNELLMEIFEYYDLYSLFNSFGLLNSRIVNILYHCKVSVNFDKVKSIDQILPKFNSTIFDHFMLRIHIKYKFLFPINLLSILLIFVRFL
jgi:hypothetical protein